MARKDCSKCGDATCNCAIIEGPGTNVTGIGSGASPYIVEADIVHVDTPTVTLTGNGGSTPLSAVVNPCGLTDNLNEVSSGSLLVKGVDPDCLAVLDPGVAGQAVVSNGTGFVLGTPTQTPITPVDTSLIDLTVSGTDDHTLSATVVPSGTVGDVLTTSAVGVVTWEPGGGSLDLCDAVFPPTLIGNDGVLVPGNAPNCVRTLVNDVQCGILAATVNGVEFVPISVYLEVFQDVFTPAVGDTVVNATDTPILRVYRNGLIQIEGVDYTVAGTAVTFTVPFGNSGGGAGLETVVLEEPVCPVL